MNPKNPLVIIIGPGRDMKGGIISVIKGYLNSDLNKFYDLRHISTYTDGNWIKRLFTFISSISIFIFISCFKNIKIVHIHSASRGSFYRKSIILFLSKILRNKVILHIHGGEFSHFYFKESGVIKKKFIKNILSLADVLIAVSYQWKLNLSKITQSKKNIHVVFNSVPPLNCTNKKNKTDYITILFAGNLNPKKGVWDLLQAIKSVIKINPKVKLILAGDGEIVKIRNWVDENFLREFIEVPGWVIDMKTYYQRADIFVLPSYIEGLPMSLLEAGRFALPVISTNVGGIPEIIEDGANGYLLDPGDIKGLKNRILLLASKPELRQTMGANFLKLTEEKFNDKKIALQVDTIYQNLIKKC